VQNLVRGHGNQLARPEDAEDPTAFGVQTTRNQPGRWENGTGTPHNPPAIARFQKAMTTAVRQVLLGIAAFWHTFRDTHIKKYGCAVIDGNGAGRATRLPDRPKGRRATSSRGQRGRWSSRLPGVLRHAKLGQWQTKPGHAGGASATRQLRYAPPEPLGSPRRKSGIRAMPRGNVSRCLSRASDWLPWSAHTERDIFTNRRGTSPAPQEVRGRGPEAFARPARLTAGATSRASPDTDCAGSLRLIARLRTAGAVAYIMV